MKAQLSVACSYHGNQHGQVFAPFHSPKPFGGFEHTSGNPAEHHRTSAPTLHIRLHVPRPAEEALDCGGHGQRLLEPLREPQPDYRECHIGAFPQAGGGTRVVGG